MKALRKFARYRRGTVTAWVMWSNREVTRLCDERTGVARDHRTETVAARWIDTETRRTDRADVRYRCRCCGVVVRVRPSVAVRAERKSGR